jgi:hypothetical protein
MFPEWKPRMAEMANHGFLWAAMIARWDDMASCMEREVGIDWSKGRAAIETYNLMKRIKADAYRANPDYECTFSDEGHLRSASRKRAA